ncbi:hypothetical protein Tco_1285231 [Tanacetum coccineum]
MPGSGSLRVGIAIRFFSTPEAVFNSGMFPIEGMTSTVRGVSRVRPAWSRLCCIWRVGITESLMHALPLVAQAVKHVSVIASFTDTWCTGSSDNEKRMKVEGALLPLPHSLLGLGLLGKLCTLTASTSQDQEKAERLV